MLGLAALVLTPRERARFPPLLARAAGGAWSRCPLWPRGLPSAVLVRSSPNVRSPDLPRRAWRGDKPCSSAWAMGGRDVVPSIARSLTLNSSCMLARARLASRALDRVLNMVLKTRRDPRRRPEVRLSGLRLLLATPWARLPPASPASGRASSMPQVRPLSALWTRASRAMTRASAGGNTRTSPSGGALGGDSVTDSSVAGARGPRM
mmetsp:Transcript_21943/g.68284  ORF Transcript_21943/g.68284 Transcript_21943/m.68284 type:complete len:207 (-) Transcript_21943:598-1218(-)